MEEETKDNLPESPATVADQVQTPSEQPSNKKIVIIILLIIAGLTLIAGVWMLLFSEDDNDPNLNNQEPTQQITSYEECVAAGYPIMESYPEQCAVPGGETFTRNISSVETTGRICTRNNGKFTCLDLQTRESTEVGLDVKLMNSPELGLSASRDGSMYIAITDIGEIKQTDRKMYLLNSDFQILEEINLGENFSIPSHLGVIFWSKDNSEIVLSTNDTNFAVDRGFGPWSSQIITYNINSKKAMNLSSNEDLTDTDVRYSKDGTKLHFFRSSSSTSGRQLVELNLATNEITSLNKPNCVLDNLDHYDYTLENIFLQGSAQKKCDQIYFIDPTKPNAEEFESFTAGDKGGVFGRVDNAVLFFYLDGELNNEDMTGIELVNADNPNESEILIFNSSSRDIFLFP